MRQLILIAAMVLVSATAQAGQTRNLTLASAEGQAATDQAKPVETTQSSESSRSVEVTPPPDAAKPAETPKFVERPAAIGTAPTQCAPQPTTTDAAKPATTQTAKADRPKHRQRGWTESQIIGELHRHGIYW